MKLLFKITTLILVALISILSVFTYYQIENEKKVLSYFLNEQGSLLSSTISAGSIETILIEDYPLLDSYLINIQNSFKTIAYIKIFVDDTLVSSIKNKDLEKHNKEIFTKDITIDSDIIAKLEIALSTKNNDIILNNVIKTSLYSILSASLILFLLLVFIVKKFLLERIEKIKNHTKLISSGVYDKTLTINTSDEFENLAEDINYMSKSIYDSNKHSEDLTTKLKAQTIELKDVIKAKDMFMANMSHELKTPLNSINVISSIMKKNKEKNLSEKQVDNLNVINLCGHNLLFLINDVLDISKLEMGGIKIKYQSFNLKVLIDEIRSTTIPLSDEKNINFKVTYDKNINYIYSDNNRVKQIIKNFLSNSLKFCEKGNIELFIADNGEYVNISVKDDGIGIKKSELPYIFDRFRQIDGSTTRKYGGSGLGLSISKELAKLLNAEIFVESEINKGSTFTLKLPKNMKMIENKPIQKQEISDKKERLLFLSKDFMQFIQLVVNLQKNFEVVQISDMKQFYEEMKKDEKEDYKHIIIDSKIVSEDDIEKINRQIVLLTDDANDIISSKLSLRKTSKAIFKRTNSEKEINNYVLKEI